MGRRKGDHSREEIARQSERASLQTDKTLNDPDKSEKLRRNMMPSRYWQNMTEFATG